MTGTMTEDQVKDLIVALASSHPEGVPESRICAWIDWCDRQRFGAILVDLVLEGELVPRWLEGQSEPQFSAKEVSGG